MARETLSDGDQRLLAELARHPGWDVLKKQLALRRERDFYNLGRKAVQEKDVPAREAAELAGFHKGVLWTLQLADKAFRDVFKREGDVKDG